MTLIQLLGMCSNCMSGDQFHFYTKGNSHYTAFNKLSDPVLIFFKDHPVDHFQVINGVLYIYLG